MRTLILFLSALASLALVSQTHATLYSILPDGSGDYPTIQAGVDAIMDGDVLELGAGTFAGPGNRDIDFLGKAITIRSQSGDPETCIIDCQGTESEPHRAFHLHSGETAGTTLSGVTITHGWMGDESRGGGIACENAGSLLVAGCILTEIHGAAALCIDGSRLEVHDCVFTGNEALEGGGICCEEATLVLEGCRFTENEAFQLGGAVHAHAAVVDLLDCEFEHNHAVHGGAADFHISTVAVVRDCRFYENHATEAGALCLYAGCNGTVEGCTFAGNISSDWASALSAGKGSGCQIQSSTFYGNSGGFGAVLLSDALCTMSQVVIAFNDGGLYQYSTVAMTCCDIFGNEGGDWIGDFADQLGVNGNICEDPLFCDPEQRDFQLNAASPCAPFSPPNPECDLIGAWPVGCSGTPVEAIRWGRLKNAFR